MNRAWAWAALVLLATPRSDAWEPISTCGADTPHWESLPVAWQLTRIGGTMYSGLPNSQVEAAFQRSFEGWTDPASCCTSFGATYLGPTTTAFDLDDTVNVIEFEEGSWDPAYGSVNSTIAITAPVWYTGSCEIFTADELYNAVGFSFTTTDSPGFGDTDLESIAAHENGHLLGLDHPPIPASTMYASYGGGIGPRSLDVDDENGLCAIYPDVCGTPREGDCANGLDDDADGDADCADDDCAAFQLCACVLETVLECDDSLSATSVGGLSEIDQFGCAGWQTTGPEATFLFHSVFNGDVTFEATGLSADLDLFVTPTFGGLSCDSDNCFGGSANGGNASESFTLTATAGSDYAVVMDGYQGAESAFTMRVICPIETVCDDGLDGDDDGATDCDDTDCDPECACVSDSDGDGVCDPVDVCNG